MIKEKGTGSRNGKESAGSGEVFTWEWGPPHGSARRPRVRVQTVDRKTSIPSRSMLCSGLYHDRLLYAQPALLPTISFTTRTLVNCFMCATLLICRLANLFSIFVASSQRLLKYLRSTRLKL